MHKEEGELLGLRYRSELYSIVTRTKSENELYAVQRFYGKAMIKMLEGMEANGNYFNWKVDRIEYNILVNGKSLIEEISLEEYQKLDKKDSLPESKIISLLLARFVGH